MPRQKSHPLPLSHPPVATKTDFFVMIFSPFLYLSPPPTPAQQPFQSTWAFLQPGSPQGHSLETVFLRGILGYQKHRNYTPFMYREIRNDREKKRSKNAGGGIKVSDMKKIKRLLQQTRQKGNHGLATNSQKEPVAFAQRGYQRTNLGRVS